MPPRGLVTLLASVCIILAAWSAYAEDFQGKVVGIIDGDTLDVMRDGRAARVRLQGIDAPEDRQPCRTRPSCGPSSPTSAARSPLRRLAPPHPPRPRSGSLPARHQTLAGSLSPGPRHRTPPPLP
jgi:endonuclease YncB( thermonuclease family)